METKKYILAIDVGTSSVRAALVADDLSVVCSAARRYSLSTPRAGWAEQDPETIAAALDEAVRECLSQSPRGQAPAGVCLDTALHSFVTLDKDRRPLTSLWTWADMRAVGAANRLKSDETAARTLYARTGCPAHPMYFPAKLSWLREHAPETFDRRARSPRSKAIFSSG